MSPSLMLIMLALMMPGCTLRVESEILGYQHYANGVKCPACFRVDWTYGSGLVCN